MVAGTQVGTGPLCRCSAGSQLVMMATAAQGLSSLSGRRAEWE